MKRETYEKMAATVEKHTLLKKCVIYTDRVLTKISYVIYPLMIIVMLMIGDPRVIRALIVPAVSFIIVSVFRYFYCAPRPYEVFGIPPAISKETKGKSFPSRHVFSSFMISCTVFWLIPEVGIVLGILSVIMSFCRVLGGVHFIKDVAAGAIIGICCGIVGFYII